MIESPLLNSKTSNVNLSKWEQLNGLKLFVSHLNWVIHFHLRYIFICDTFSFVIQFIKLQFTIVNFLQSVEGGTHTIRQSSVCQVWFLSIMQLFVPVHTVQTTTIPAILWISSKMFEILSNECVFESVLWLQCIMF